MLQAGRRLAVEHPLTGVGPGQVKTLYPSVATAEALRHSTSHLHNTPLQIVVERGVIGLVTWLWIFVAFLVRGTALLRRLPPEAGGDRALVLGSVAAVVTLLVGGLFEYNFGDTEVLLVALALWRCRSRSSPSAPRPAHEPRSPAARCTVRGVPDVDGCSRRRLTRRDGDEVKRFDVGDGQGWLAREPDSDRHRARKHTTIVTPAPTISSHRGPPEPSPTQPGLADPSPPHLDPADRLYVATTSRPPCHAPRRDLGRRRRASRSPGAAP